MYSTIIGYPQIFSACSYDQLNLVIVTNKPPPYTKNLVIIATR